MRKIRRSEVRKGAHTRCMSFVAGRSEPNRLSLTNTVIIRRRFEGAAFSTTDYLDVEVVFPQ